MSSVFSLYFQIIFLLKQCITVISCLAHNLCNAIRLTLVCGALLGTGNSNINFFLIYLRCRFSRCHLLSPFHRAQFLSCHGMGALMSQRMSQTELNEAWALPGSTLTNRSRPTMCLMESKLVSHELPHRVILHWPFLCHRSVTLSPCNLTFLWSSFYNFIKA